MLVPSCAIYALAILSLGIVPAWADPLALQVTGAEVAHDQSNGEPVVSVRLDESSKRLFADFTARNVGKSVELRLDGRSVTMLVFGAPITGGTFQIGGALAVERARQLAERLASGAARLELEAASN